jgi:hypothetical protein
MRTDRIAVLVLPAGLRAGPWACKSLSAAGYRVIAAHERGGPPLVARTRHADRVLHYPPPRERPTEFLEWIDDACRVNSAAAVVPLSESVLHLLAAELPEPGGARLVGPTIEQYRRLCDKEALIPAAASIGIDTPPGTLADGGTSEGAWPPLPSIVKPRASATPTDSGVVYAPAVLVETPEERTRAVSALVGDCGGALVQELVRGERFRIHFVRHRHGLSASAQLTVRSYPRVTGMSSVSLAVEIPGELRRATEGLLDLVDYRGPGSTQFIRGDGRFYLHDVNLRLEYSLGSSISAGLDSPRLSVDDVLGRPLGDLGPSETGRHYVWLGGEARALLDGVRGRRTAAPVSVIARDLLLAGISPRRVLDRFSLLDPLPTVGDMLPRMRRSVDRRPQAT